MWLAFRRSCCCATAGFIGNSRVRVDVCDRVWELSGVELRLTGEFSVLLLLLPGVVELSGVEVRPLPYKILNVELTPFL